VVGIMNRWPKTEPNYRDWNRIFWSLIRFWVSGNRTLSR
jgi:hypothetical protein